MLIRLLCGHSYNGRFSFDDILVESHRLKNIFKTHRGELDKCRHIVHWILVKKKLNEVSFKFFINIIFQNIVRKRCPYCLRPNIRNGTNQMWIKDIVGDGDDRYGYLNFAIWFSCGKPASKSAFLWRHFGEEIFSGIFGSFIYRYSATNGYRLLFSLGSNMSSTRRFDSGIVGRLHAIRCYVVFDSVLNRPGIGVRSADIWLIHNRSKTDWPSAIGGRLKTDTSSNAPRQNLRHTDI